jgi:hydroxymethylglutaryl-CoA lyase
VRLIEALAAAGLKNIEVTSFVSPKWIPQLADGLEVCRALKLPADVIKTALVPNMKGYESASQAGLSHIALFMSTTESHSKKNINKSVDEALSMLGELSKQAKADGKWVRCYLSVVFECPYEGTVSPDQVSRITDKLVELGVDEISLGDTIGAATPRQVENVVKLVLRSTDKSKLALHFHDTRGTALANVLAGLELGVSIFDSSLGGLGGCPYAPGAAGNLATEDLVYMLNGMGVKTGVDLEKLVDAGCLAEELLERKQTGRYLRACLSTRGKENCSNAGTASAVKQ